MWLFLYLSSLEAFIDFKKQFRKYIKSGMHEKYAIEVSDLLKEDDFYKWLEKHGLKEKILDFYQKVKLQRKNVSHKKANKRKNNNTNEVLLWQI